jgi:hypothetical protein
MPHKEVLAYKQFADMSYQGLHRKLKEMIERAQQLSVSINAVARVNLLPALQAMHDKVAQPGRRERNPNQPTWDDECRMLGITPEQVRQWKRRTQTDTDIRHLLGEMPNKPGKGKSEDRIALAAKHLEMICKSVLDGDEKRAEQLAMAFAERHGF